MVLAAHFFIFSFAGWILDSSYRSILGGTFSEGSALGIPLLPIYGFGAILLIYLKPYLPKNKIKQFFIIAFALGGLEYVGGVFTLYAFQERYWEYTGAFDLHGHTDAWHVFLWGILGMIFIHYIHPRLHPFLKRKFLVK